MKYGGHYGVTLIAILVHAMEAHHVKVGTTLLKGCSEHFSAFAAVIVVHKIGLGLPHNRTIDPIARFSQPSGVELVRCLTS